LTRRLSFYFVCQILLSVFLLAFLFNCHANSHQQETKLNKLLYQHKKCV